MYSLESIALMDLLNNPQNYEVDHIIPRSVAFDNSIHNKVLVKQIENSKKVIEHHTNTLILVMQSYHTINLSNIS